MKFIKKYIKLIIFFIICLIIFLIFKFNNHHNITYISLGDSFALGKNSYGQFDYGYSDYVKDYLEKNNKLNKYFKTFSEEDASIKTLYQNISLNKKIKLKDREFNLKQSLREANILTLTIGINDLIYKLSILDNLDKTSIDKIIKSIEKDFNNLIKEIKKYYPKEIYVVGYYNIYPENTTYEYAIKELNKIYIKNKDVIYIDTFELLDNNHKYIPNFLNYYPTAEGYKIISEQIIIKISKKLEK